MAFKTIHYRRSLRRKHTVQFKLTKKSKSNLASEQKRRAKTHPNSKATTCTPASDMDWESDETESKGKCEVTGACQKLKTGPDAKKDPFIDIEIKPRALTRGLLCELHTYDARYNSKGERIYLRTGSKSEVEFGAEIERSAEAALVLTRYYDDSHPQSVPKTTLEIKSPHIQLALRNVIEKYPGVNIGSARGILLFEEPRCLFHYREELRRYAMASKSLEAREHILFSLRYMERYLRNEISIFDGMMNSNGRAPGLDFQNLWMAFRPGALLYNKNIDVEEVAQLRSMDIVKPITNSRKYWVVRTEILVFDGTNLGRVERSHQIVEYDGYKSLFDLIIFPLQYHPEQERIRRELVARGKKYMTLFGSHFRMYEGAAEFLLNESRRYFLKREEVQHRIVVDCREFYIDNLAPRLVPGSTIKIDEDEHKEMGDDQFLICSSKIQGFSLVTKKWAYFQVDRVKDIEFDANAFESLVLPVNKKRMISSLVKTSRSDQDHFDDFIRGKGKGNIFLLHGPPGVGKTFTAESIAEHTRRPLYTISCGDLGLSASLAEQQLKGALSRATRWNAVILIDEADVFMQQRSLSDLQRNELVSVLLRTLEYFEGILFLTTNRVEVIDQAFKSRIHFSIAYPPLSAESRRELWRTFVMKSVPDRYLDRLDDNFLKEVSKFDVNGRQIKNAVRVAHSLAVNENRGIIPEDIFSILEALRSFDEDFDRSVEQNESRSGTGGASMITARPIVLSKLSEMSDKAGQMLSWSQAWLIVSSICLVLFTLQMYSILCNKLEKI